MSLTTSVTDSFSPSAGDRIPDWIFRLAFPALAKPHDDGPLWKRLSPYFFQKKDKISKKFLTYTAWSNKINVIYILKGVEEESSLVTKEHSEPETVEVRYPVGRGENHFRAAAANGYFLISCRRSSPSRSGICLCMFDRWLSEAEIFVLWNGRRFLFCRRKQKGGFSMYEKVSTNLNFVEREKKTEKF